MLAALREHGPATLLQLSAALDTPHPGIAAALYRLRTAREVQGRFQNAPLRYEWAARTGNA